MISSVARLETSRQSRKKCRNQEPNLFLCYFILYHIAFQTTENETMDTNINMKVSFKRPDLEKIETEYFWQQLST